jgi:hypothetical protein
MMLLAIPSVHFGIITTIWFANSFPS